MHGVTEIDREDFVEVIELEPSSSLDNVSACVSLLWALEQLSERNSGWLALARVAIELVDHLITNIDLTDHSCGYNIITLLTSATAASGCFKPSLIINWLTCNYMNSCAISGNNCIHYACSYVLIALSTYTYNYACNIVWEWNHSSCMLWVIIVYSKLNNQWTIPQSSNAAVGSLNL